MNCQICGREGYPDPDTGGAPDDYCQNCKPHSECLNSSWGCVLGWDSNQSCPVFGPRLRGINATT